VFNAEALQRYTLMCAQQFPDGTTFAQYNDNVALRGLYLGVQITFIAAFVLLSCFYFTSLVSLIDLSPSLPFASFLLSLSLLAHAHSPTVSRTHTSYHYLGGLRDKPSKPRDFYHSCYNLGGLSVSQHAAVVNTGGGTSGGAAGGATSCPSSPSSSSPLVWGSESNRVAVRVFADGNLCVVLNLFIFLRVVFLYTQLCFCLNHYLFCILRNFLAWRVLELTKLMCMYSCNLQHENRWCIPHSICEPAP